jgi:hypothetical protein
VLIIYGAAGGMAVFCHQYLAATGAYHISNDSCYVCE